MGTPANTTEHPVLQFDTQTVEALKEMAAWWMNKRGEEMPAQEAVAPRFKMISKSETSLRSIRLPTTLLQMADRKAKLERERTGGTVNALIQWLLWRYVGEPAEFLAVEPAPPAGE